MSGGIPGCPCEVETLRADMGLLPNLDALLGCPSNLPPDLEQRILDVIAGRSVDGWPTRDAAASEEDG